VSPPGIRLVLDQGVPRYAADLLRQRGCECTHVGEVGMFRAEDTEILAWARERGCIVITLDADFHAILAVSRATQPSVIRLRMQALDAQRVATLVQGVIGDYGNELTRGCMITVKPQKTTCHILPAGSV
jgi:predicted nuclease of predicted toxin-antitoxin system